MVLSPFGIASPAVIRRPPPIWTYLVADLRTGAILEEIPLTGVTWSKKLNDSGTMSGTWSLGPAEKRDAYALTTPCKTALFAVRDTVPMWGGIIWTRSYDSETEKVSIQAGDWWTYFDHRKVVPFLNTTKGNTHYVAAQSVSYSATDQNQIARNLVTLAQAHTAGNIGIELDSTESGIARDRTYFGYELQSVGDVLRQLAGILDGPDMMFDVGQGNGTEQPRRLLRIGTPYLGQQGSAHVWETGGNVVSYTWPSDGTKMATRTYAVGDGIEQAALIAFDEDFTKYPNGWPLLELETGYTTVTDDATLNAHAQSDLDAARLPVVLPALKVRGDMPPFLGQFNVGDDARMVIAADRFHRDGLDTSVRIVQMDVTPESDKGEQVTLTMAPLIEGVV